MTVNPDIRPLIFENEHMIRTVEMNDGETWFVGLDLCRALGIVDHTRALGRLAEDERGWRTVPPLGGLPGCDPSGQMDNQLRRVIIISELGVYRVVFTSRKPIAKRFKRWLFQEVLPTLRLVTECRQTFGHQAATQLWSLLMSHGTSKN